MFFEPIGLDVWQQVLSPPYETAEIRYVADSPPHRPSVGWGDCETFAANEYHRLRLEGREAYVVIGLLPSGEWHAVVWAGEWDDPLGLDLTGFRPLFAVDEDGGYLLR